MNLNPPVASLAFLSFPGPGIVCINLQIDGKDVKAEITRDQLRGLLMDGASKVFEEEKRT